MQQKINEIEIHLLKEYHTSQHYECPGCLFTSMLFQDCLWLSENLLATFINTQHISIYIFMPWTLSTSEFIISSYYTILQWKTNTSKLEVSTTFIVHVHDKQGNS